MKVSSKTILLPGEAGGLGVEITYLPTFKGTNVFPLDFCKERGLEVEKSLQGLDGDIVFVKLDSTSSQERGRVFFSPKHVFPVKGDGYPDHQIHSSVGQGR